MRSPLASQCVQVASCVTTLPLRRSLPSLKLFGDGEFQEDYRGERTAAGIISYVAEKLAADIWQPGEA